MISEVKVHTKSDTELKPLKYGNVVTLTGKKIEFENKTDRTSVCPPFLNLSLSGMLSLGK